MMSSARRQSPISAGCTASSSPRASPALSWVLPGCTWLWGTASSGGATAEEQAGADIRDPTPAIEAFYAENGTYAGVTTTGPRTTSDAQVPDVRIVVTSRDSYCIEMTGEGQTYAARGPCGDVGVGRC